MADFCTKTFTITVGQLGIDDIDQRAFCKGEEILFGVVTANQIQGAGAVAPFDGIVLEGQAELDAAGYLVAFTAGTLPGESYFSITGTPTSTLPVTFTLQVRDDAAPDNNVAEREFTLYAAEILNPAGALASAGLGSAYDQALTQAGAPAVVTWAITSGKAALLAAGFTFDESTGQIGGVPHTPGTYSFTVTLKSSGA